MKELSRRGFLTSSATAPARVPLKSRLVMVKPRPLKSFPRAYDQLL